jgi:hypothetical protein
MRFQRHLCGWRSLANVTFGWFSVVSEVTLHVLEPLFIPSNICDQPNKRELVLCIFYIYYEITFLPVVSRSVKNRGLSL